VKADVPLREGGDVATNDAREGGNVDTGGPDADAMADTGDADAAGDSSDADALVEADGDAAPNLVLQYALAYGQAFCTGQGKCCAGYPTNFDLASCASAYHVSGFDFTLPQNALAYVNGHLNYNPDAGGNCLTALQNFTCPNDAGAVPNTEYSTIINACLGVLTGTIANGSGGCVSSYECANGFCDLTADGGAGTGVCTGLVGDGGACTGTVGISDTVDQMCSQAGQYQPMLWCNRVDGGTTGNCQPPFANGASCYNSTTGYFTDYGCTSLMCDDNGLCGTSVTYPLDVCSYLDAGGGG
jgi:hypothetical protein